MTVRGSGSILVGLGFGHPSGLIAGHPLVVRAGGLECCPGSGTLSRFGKASKLAIDVLRVIHSLPAIFDPQSGQRGKVWDSLFHFMTRDHGGGSGQKAG